MKNFETTFLAALTVLLVVSGCAEKKNCNADKAPRVEVPAPTPAPVVEAPEPTPTPVVVDEEIEQVVEEMPKVDEKTRAVQ